MESCWKELRRELKAERDLTEAMQPLLARIAPESERFDYPWQEDAERLRWWLFENLDARRLPESADQLWFRLFTIEWREHVDSCDVELVGGMESDYFATPIGRTTWRVPTPVLGSVVLPRLVRSLGVVSHAEAELAKAKRVAVAYTALAVQAALRGIDEALLQGSLPSRGVSVGFDGGPGVYLGRFDGERWDREDLCCY